MLATAWHPDYSVCTWDVPSHGDRCICGGVRYWHAVAGLGCDDCPCEDFVLAESAETDGDSLAQRVTTLLRELPEISVLDPADPVRVAWTARKVALLAVLVATP